MRDDERSHFREQGVVDFVLCTQGRGNAREAEGRNEQRSESRQPSPFYAASTERGTDFFLL
jgi:hypothetical protein